ncbi:Surfeit locus protein 2 [Bagarius yarrelli]|uniref:Surfeit locus protein 2 n=1 Tax=Bagarius yarrelli TaxID=175774 RepID=A0A556TYJ1_BAGYA|nr:Surfeit locus protein 2 [Bagarius yarrelli]
MDDLPADLREFLENQPFLQLTDAKKIQCTLNGHELPCDLAELQRFISGKKYKKLSAGKEFNYSQYEPHLVPSTKQPKQLFCKLTLRHINRMPHHVLRHVGGKRFKKALAEYEECLKQGVNFVPARLRQKKPPRDSDDDMESRSEGKGKHKQKQDSGIWAPSSSEGEGSDSDDSMSDLYPCPVGCINQEIKKEPKEKRLLDPPLNPFSPLQDFLSSIMANSAVKFVWCSCRNYKIQSKDTHEKCLICLGIQHAKEAVLEYGKCPHCAKMEWGTCIKRLTKVQEVIHQEAQQRKNEASQTGNQAKSDPVASSVPVKEVKSMKLVSATPAVPETEISTPAPSFSAAPVMFTLLSPSVDRPDLNTAAVKGTYVSHVALPHNLDLTPSVPPTQIPSTSRKRRHSSRCRSCCMKHSSRACGRRRKQSPSSSSCSSWSSDSSYEFVRKKRSRRETRSSTKLDRKKDQLLEMMQQKLEAQQKAMQVQWSAMECRLSALEKRTSSNVPHSAETSQAFSISQMDQEQQTGTIAASGSASLLPEVKREDGPEEILHASKSSLSPQLSSLQEFLTSEQLQSLILRAAKRLGINFPESQNDTPHPVMLPEFKDLIKMTWSNPATSPPYRPLFTEWYKLHESQAPNYDHMPQVNKLISAIFQAVTPASTRNRPDPPEHWRFIEVLAENSYRTAGMLVKMANYLRYLSDYQRRLLAEVSENPTCQSLPDVLSELKLIGEFIFLLSSHQAELSGRIMAASVAVKRHAWMDKSSYTDSLRATFADHPFAVETQQ